MVDVDRRALGADADRDQVPVPGRELLEREEQLLPLGASRRAPQPLLGVTIRQLEPFELLLGLRPSFLRPLACRLDERR